MHASFLVAMKKIFCGVLSVLQRPSFASVGRKVTDMLVVCLIKLSHQRSLDKEEKQLFMTITSYRIISKFLKGDLQRGLTLCHTHCVTPNYFPECQVDIPVVFFKHCFSFWISSFHSFLVLLLISENDF